MENNLERINEGINKMIKICKEQKIEENILKEKIYKYK